MIAPVCVVTGDVHFTPTTLELASAVIKQAIDRASALRVPLVINGDLLDTKAIIRGECANRLISLLEEAECRVIINTGNHDLIHEKAKESSLNFLKPWAYVISYPVYVCEINAWVVPYQHDSEEMWKILSNIPKGETIFVHQGVHSANMGHYTQDKTSLPKEAYADFRVIGSHYHTRQDIKCGRPRKGAVGLFSYVGNPYSLNFGEASDPEKGFQILMDDGKLEFVPTNLRKHVVHECEASNITPPSINPGDLLWLKVKGTRSELEKIKKNDLSVKFGISDFKLDKIVLDSPQAPVAVKKQCNVDLLDSIISSTNETAEQKEYLKRLYRELV